MWSQQRWQYTSRLVNVTSQSGQSGWPTDRRAWFWRTMFAMLPVLLFPDFWILWTPFRCLVGACRSIVIVDKFLSQITVEKLKPFFVWKSGFFFIAIFKSTLTGAIPAKEPFLLLLKLVFKELALYPHLLVSVRVLKPRGAVTTVPSADELQPLYLGTL